MKGTKAMTRGISRAGKRSTVRPAARGRLAAGPPGKILVSGIKFHGYHGLTRIEREIGVRYSVDVEMTYDFSAAARTDHVNDTIDYREVHHLVIGVGKTNSYRLIETLASRIVEAILARTRASTVLVRVRKETPILDGIVDAVSVELQRDRGTP